MPLFIRAVVQLMEFASFVFFLILFASEGSEEASLDRGTTADSKILSPNTGVTVALSVHCTPYSLLML